MVDDPAFDRKARERLAGFARGKGPCPGAETLNLYASGQLPAPQSESVRRHIVLCGQCDLILEKLKEFDRPEESGKRGPWWRLFWHPAVAWACVCLLLIPAWRGWRMQPAAPPPAALAPAPPPPAEVPGIQSLTYLNLNRTRGIAPRALSDEGPTVVAFTVPSIRGASYFARLRSGGREFRQPIYSWNGYGSYYLLVEDPALLTDGCQLVVEETNKARKTREVATFDCTRQP